MANNMNVSACIFRDFDPGDMEGEGLLSERARERRD
jgi:hypothetical protein